MIVSFLAGVFVGAGVVLVYNIFFPAKVDEASQKIKDKL